MRIELDLELRMWMMRTRERLAILLIYELSKPGCLLQRVQKRKEVTGRLPEAGSCDKPYQHLQRRYLNQMDSVSAG
jgi:hypothetical protein